MATSDELWYGEPAMYSDVDGRGIMRGRPIALRAAESPGYRAPSQPPCSFRAAEAMTLLFERGVEVEGRIGIHESIGVRAAKDTLNSVRAAMMSKSRRHACVLNLSATWGIYDGASGVVHTAEGKLER